MDIFIESIEIYFLVLCLVFLFGYFSVNFLMPLAIKKAIRLRLLDAPGVRKVHKYSKPRVGGIVMFVIYFIILVVLGYLFKIKIILPIAVSSLIIAFFGFLDDLFNIRALYKLIMQLLVAVMTAVPIIGFGIDIHTLHIFEGYSFSLGLFSIPFTIMWIIGIMNAINLIDGLDGLAGGITAIASFSLLACAIFWKDYEMILIILALFAVVVGFLKYNFNPAKVFMGDTGSLLLGYNLAVISIIVCWNQPKVMSFGIPLILLGIPIYDVFSSIGRRISRNQNIFIADGEHFHHRIMKRGFTHKQTVIIIYIESFFLAISALVTLFIDTNIMIIYLISLAFLIHISRIYLKKKFI
jgi:UDP-GlcNAc:undecaprenyl-phosphate/decaprenyl-phosphate GlcNAc-1-phosphate transferase